MSCFFVLIRVPALGPRIPSPFREMHLKWQQNRLFEEGSGMLACGTLSWVIGIRSFKTLIYIYIYWWSTHTLARVCGCCCCFCFNVLPLQLGRQDHETWDANFQSSFELCGTGRTLWDWKLHTDHRLKNDSDRTHHMVTWMAYSPERKTSFLDQQGLPSKVTAKECHVDFGAILHMLRNSSTYEVRMLIWQQKPTGFQCWWLWNRVNLWFLRHFDCCAEVLSWSLEDWNASVRSPIGVIMSYQNFRGPAGAGFRWHRPRWTVEDGGSLSLRPHFHI